MAREEKINSQPTTAEIERWEEDKRFEDAVANGVATLEESPALNRMLMRHARKSPNEIEKLTGIPADEVAERLTALLDNKGWRDDLMEEKLLLNEVAMLVDDIRERMSRAFVEDEGWASMARVQLQAIKTLLEQLEKRRKAVDGKLALVTMLQAQLMADAIKVAQDKAIRRIQEKFPDLDTDIIYAEFEEALPEAIALLEGRASD